MTDPKVLLMPVYTRGNEIERLRGALSLACFFNAHLNVVHAQSKPSDRLENELFALPSNVRERIVSIMDEGAHEEQEEHKTHFLELCEQAGVVLSDMPKGGKPTANWRDFDGARSEMVALQGRVSDLIIIPHSKSGGATLTFEEAILHTGRPVLLVPRGMWEFRLSNVLIGWNGGLEVSRAVQQSLPFLLRASSVTIAVSHDKADDRPTARDLAAYLEHHSIASDIRELGGVSASAGEGLLKLAADTGCDFLVTGGYSHTRLRQSILGGVTSHLLKHADIPILMAH